MWPEIDLVKSENRHELVLSGSAISARIEEEGLLEDLFSLLTLNYLNISETKLDAISSKIAQLENLQTLVLHSNALTEAPEEIFSLSKLKILDLSRNKLQKIPDSLASLTQLTTLNISSNALESFPTLKLTKLAVLDLSNNKLSDFPDIGYPEVSVLHDLKLNANCIQELPAAISKLGSLKVFDISANKIKVIPGQLADCHKLKDLNLKDNPVADRRLLKLISQCRTKQVLDYVVQNCPKINEAPPAQNSAGANETEEAEKVPQGLVDSEPDLSNKFQLIVEHFDKSPFRIIRTDLVKTVRAHILGCIVSGFEFTDVSFKKFIQLQTRLHSDICLKRQAATIATHDLKKLSPGDLTYTIRPRDALTIIPLNAIKPVSGAALLTRLENEAEALRKEKKRKVYSGIHMYLHLVQGKPNFPCLLDNGGGKTGEGGGEAIKDRVISFPPITNAEGTKLTVDTKSMFLEVTSSTSLNICKKVLDELIKECYFLFKNDVKALTIGQIKVVDPEGNLKAVYPAKDDLVFDQNLPIYVQRNLQHK